VEKIYVNKSGTVYANVKNFSWEELQDYKIIKETSHVMNFQGKSSRDFEDLDDGTWICQSVEDKNVGYRIDLRYLNPFIDNQSSARNINDLQSIQPNIKLTEFPYGVITRDNRVVGEVMPFYPDSINILDYIKETTDENILNVYKQVLNILKEMYENGIVYRDIHGGNFVITNKNENPLVHAIDFEDMFIKINKNLDYMDFSIRGHLHNLRNFLNNIKKFIKSQEAQDYITNITDNYEKTIKR